MTLPYAPNHNPASLKGDYANRPSGTDLQNLPFLTTYLATNTSGPGVGTLSIVGGTGNIRQWIEYSASANLGTKGPVRLASTGVLPAYTASADKTTLTANAPGAFPAIDGFTLTINQRFLLKDAEPPTDNGLYQLAASGSAGTPWVLARTPDMPVGDAVSGATVNVEQGTLNGSQQFIVTSPPGSDVVGTNNVTWLQETGLGFFVNAFWNSATGSDANDGKTAATAWQTFAPVAAVLKQLEQTNGQCRITDVTPGGGTFVMPVVAPGNSTFLQLVQCPAWGTTSEPVTFIGAPGADATGGLGTRTAGVVATTTRAGLTVATITDGAGAVYVANALKGARFRVTSGAAINKCVDVDSNTTSVITLISSLAGFVLGDQYVVERPTTKFVQAVGSNSCGFVGPGAGIGGAIFYGIKFTNQAAALGDFTFNNGSWLFSFCEVDGTPAGGFRLRLNNSNVQSTGRFTSFNGGGVNKVPSGIQPLDTNSSDCCYVHDTAESTGGIDAENCSGAWTGVVSNCVIQASNSTKMFWTVGMHFPTATNGGCVLVQDTLGLAAGFIGRVWVYPSTNLSGGFILDIGCQANLFGFQVVSNVYGVFAANCIIVDHHSYLHLTGFTAAVGTITNFALNVRHNSDVDVTDANVGSTAVGTAGAVQVGALAAPSTWAQIAGGTAALCTDLAAANSEICRVGPA